MCFSIWPVKTTGVQELRGFDQQSSGNLKNLRRNSGPTISNRVKYQVSLVNHFRQRSLMVRQSQVLILKPCFNAAPWLNHARNVGLTMVKHGIKPLKAQCFMVKPWLNPWLKPHFWSPKQPMVFQPHIFDATLPCGNQMWQARNPPNKIRFSQKLPLSSGIPMEGYQYPTCSDPRGDGSDLETAVETATTSIGDSNSQFILRLKSKIQFKDIQKEWELTWITWTYQSFWAYTLIIINIIYKKHDMRTTRGMQWPMTKRCCWLAHMGRSQNMGAQDGHLYSPNPGPTVEVSPRSWILTHTDNPTYQLQNTILSYCIIQNWVYNPIQT